MFCPKCGTPNQDGAKFCISCGLALAAGAEAPSSVPAEVVYAGFFDRLAALFVDCYVLGASNIITLVLAAILIPLVGSRGDSDAGIAIILTVIYLMPLVFSAAYYSLMESGERGATLGKRLLKLRVVDTSGNRIGKGRALGRWFAHALSNFSFLIGYLIQPFTARKQALHDMASGTLVIKSDARANTKAIAIVVIVITLLFTLLILGIMAAITIPALEDNRTRAAVMQGASLAGPTEMAITLYYQNTGKLPSALEQTELPRTDNSAASVALTPGTGEFIITFATTMPGAVAGKSIRYTPELQANAPGMIGPWHCTSESIPHALLPRECRD